MVNTYEINSDSVIEVICKRIFLLIYLNINTEYLISMQDFPTPLLPISKNLKRWSYSY